MTIIMTDLENVNFTRTDASALALQLKRLCWSELRSYAVSDNEAYQIKYAVHKLQNALAEAGFAPR